MSTESTGTTAAPASHTATRVAAVDLIRGAVMILMAIDHVRVYSGLPAGGPTAGIFFTRWITHFCAPAFVFLAGTSYFLSSRRRSPSPHGGEGVRGRGLLVRGLWLILLELTVIRVAWTFNFDFGHYMLAGVIWMLGWSMIVLGGLVRLPTKWIATIGIAIIALHNALGPPLGQWVRSLESPWLLELWKVVYLGFFAGPIEFGANGPYLTVLYSLIPWIGVMAAGYAFGHVLTLEPARRNRLCLQIGLGATALFLVLRGFNLYGDPWPWTAQTAAAPEGRPAMPALLAFLNTTKYPASLNFLLMTLGPIIALMPLLERLSFQGARGAWSGFVAVFGRVPFFYYMLHIPLIHLLAMVVSQVRLGEVSSWLFANHPMGNPPAPDGYMWSLGLLYLVFAIAILLLYPACRWFANLKSRRADWWLRYL